MADRTSTHGRGRRLGLFAALAVVVVLAAVGSVLYVSTSPSGNEVAEARCSADSGLAAAINEKAIGEVAAVQPVDQPFDVSGLEFSDADGKPRTLADFKGKTLLVNLWATWCVPCRKEMPALDALSRQKDGEGFAVVPINVDLGDAEKPKAFYADTNLTALPFFHDGSMASFNTLKGKGLAIGLPVSLIVSKDGCARAAINGPAEWASPDAERLIDAVEGSTLPST